MTPHPSATLPRAGGPCQGWAQITAGRVPGTQASSNQPALHPTPTSAGPEPGSTRVGAVGFEVMPELAAQPLN